MNRDRNLDVAVSISLFVNVLRKRLNTSVLSTAVVKL